MYTFHEPKLLTLNTLKNSRYSCVIPTPCEILGGTEYAYKPNELIPTPICFQGKKTCLYLYTLQALRQVASKRTGPFCQSPQTDMLHIWGDEGVKELPFLIIQSSPLLPH